MESGNPPQPQLPPDGDNPHPEPPATAPANMPQPNVHPHSNIDFSGNSFYQQAMDGVLGTLPLQHPFPAQQPPAALAVPPVPAPPAAWGDDEDSEDEMDPEQAARANAYDSDDSEQGQGPRPWQAITEDMTEPCADEMAYLVSKGEHSALDHEYWEKETFFDLSDPEVAPGESGRIDWLIEGFNGTKEKPNNELLMRSPIARIGGLDWQIKFYPKGNGSQYLSVYLECVSMLSPDYAETEEFQNPPFPFLEGAAKVQRRRSVAAQISVVMYNPGEPRVYEVQAEAHQFHKKQADYGWVYFSRYPRHDFHHRQHTQRQAILRNDQLAFKAYIRVISDPTGSMWEHGTRLPDQITSITGLRPFKKSLQYIAGVVPLLHFAPFRKFIQDLNPDTQLARWLQPLLLKMFTRLRSATYDSRGTIQEGDVMEMLWKVNVMFQSEHDGLQLQQWQDLVGSFHSEKGSVCGSNRLNTKDYASVQDAVNNHTRSIACPQLLTLELQRQEHDKKVRKWRKLTNRVRIDNHIQVEGVQYTLFAFITHCGHLMSSRYNSYVRPSGIRKGWYGYQAGLVDRLTEKEAHDRHSGPDIPEPMSKSPVDSIPSGWDSPHSSELPEPPGEVASVVMYVRDDVAAEAFAAPTTETWVPPYLSNTTLLSSLPNREAIKGDAALSDPPASGIQEAFNPEEGLFGFNQPDEAARLAVEAGLIERAATVATPEPVQIGSEDTIMRDADEDLMQSVEALEAVSTDNTLERGTFSWLGRCHYEGQWKDSKYHGGGYLISTNGDEYIGSFKNGLKHGFGKMTYSNSGDVYSGDWEEDQHHGPGKLTEFTTGNVFEGNWKHGRKHGDFVLRGKVTEEDRSCCTICYERELSTAFYDCGHVVACRECANQIDTCPLCRRRVQARLQLYGVRLSTG